MYELLTLRFGVRKTVGRFLATNMSFRVGDRCVVSTERGVELGMVLDTRQLDSNGTKETTLGKALRRATERDLYLYEKKKDWENTAYRLCRKQIKAHKLSMKLSEVEYIFDGSRVIIYFTANRRVDFRRLVKQLARRLRTRIEMRQVGARDEAKLIGGLGCCGLGQNCSALFLKELKSVERANRQTSGLENEHEPALRHVRPAQVLSELRGRALPPKMQSTPATATKGQTAEEELIREPLFFVKGRAISNRPILVARLSHWSSAVGKPPLHSFLQSAPLPSFCCRSFVRRSKSGAFLESGAASRKSRQAWIAWSYRAMASRVLTSFS